jgi:hypothetical protein
MKPEIPTLLQRVSIHLLKKDQKLKDWLNEAIVKVQSTFVVVDNIQPDKSRVSNDHFLGPTPRTSKNLWQRFRAGSLHYLFVQVSVFVRFDPPLVVTNISIVIYEESVVTAIQRLPATNIVIFLTRA